MRRWSLPVLLLLLSAAPAAAQIVPPNFVVENAFPGAGFVVPVQVVWLPDGRMLVVEKRGRIQVVKNGIKNATPMWSRDSEVLDQQDRGFLSVAVDPNYFVNHFIYLLYTVDPDSNGVDDNLYGWGRLTRYTVNFTDSSTVIASSRTILMGTTWANGPEILSPSHTIGSLRFGSDGSLLVGAGDGADFTQPDGGGAQPAAFGAGMVPTYDDIGAFRAQDVNTLCGKILRINPANGHGYMSNPFHDSNLASKRSKVWEYGLRNPYRFNLRPGTGSTDTSAANPGTIYIGDVGWDTWEEMNIAPTGGMNFGWPCYEGPFSTTYQTLAPTHTGCNSEGTSANPSAHSDPPRWWNHTDGTNSNPTGLTGNASIGGTFYTGGFYPGLYNNKYFFADYGAGWLKYATLDANNNVLAVDDFGDALQGPVDVEIDPATGDIIYVSIYTNQVRRIRYTGGGGGNNAPQAHAQGSPNVGAAPLPVSFASTGTIDLDGDPMTLTWNFGDGQGATGPTASHTYPLAGLYNSVLTADDGKGGIGRDTVRVIVLSSSTFPTTSVLDDFNRADGGMGANWGDDNGSLAIQSGQLKQTISTWGDAVWLPTSFGPNQEAFYTFNAITANSPEHDLELKVQNASWTGGLIEVHYDANGHTVVLNTYDTGNSWRGWLLLTGITYSTGDQFGARAYANGTVEIYKNGSKIGTGNVSAWPFSASGGYIGLEMALATSTRIDNFGGGNAVLNANTPPLAFITSPLDSSFFATGDTVMCRGHAYDAQDSASALTYRWEIDLHHNNHIHPVSYQADSAAFNFIAANHDDGTGVWFEMRFIVTDTGGMKDTVRTFTFPSIDLQASAPTVNPPTPGTTTPANFVFKIYNRGAMPAPYSHWRLQADNSTLLAEGDTLIAPHDSVAIALVLPPTLAAGNHVLRAMADTLHTVVETNESNNGASTSIQVVTGGTGLDAPGGITRLSLSDPYPNPASGRITVMLALPRAARVEFDVLDVQGRRVWREPARDLDSGLWPLAWNGRMADGREAHPGLFLARTTIDGHATIRRFVLLH